MCVRLRVTWYALRLLGTSSKKAKLIEELNLLEYHDPRASQCFQMGEPLPLVTQSYFYVCVSLSSSEAGILSLHDF
jgi:hypothetical protein